MSGWSPVTQPWVVRGGGGAHSLLEEGLPVHAHKIPGQRLPSHVAGNAVDGGHGILAADHAGVQGIVKVPARD